VLKTVVLAITVAQFLARVVTGAMVAQPGMLYDVTKGFLNASKQHSERPHRWPMLMLPFPNRLASASGNCRSNG